MKKSEIFDVLLSKVAEKCEVDEEDIVRGCKLQSVVDARVLLVQYLRRIGLSNDDIAAIFLRRNGADTTTLSVKKKAKSIDKMFASYSQRCLDSYAFCLISEDIRDYCRDTYEGVYVYGMKQLPHQKPTSFR